MADKRIIELDNVASVTDDDYVMIDNATNGTGKVKATLFGGGIDYSTTEQDTGVRWIDGKPIYQKTFVISNNNYVDISELNIDTFVGINGLCSVDNGTVIIPIYDNVTSEYRCYLDMDIGNTRMRLNVYGWTLDSGHITLQYTKTTDTVS